MLAVMGRELLTALTRGYQHGPGDAWRPVCDTLTAAGNKKKISEMVLRAQTLRGLRRPAAWRRETGVFPIIF